MRDLFLATIIFGSLPLILVRPWLGILMWSWVSFMNPHRMAWGYMYDMNVAMAIAVATLIGWIVCKEDRRIPVNAITVLMGMLVLWSSVTTAFALNPDAGVPQWIQYVKIIFMTYILLSLMKKEEYVRYLVWVTVLSIGYFGLKGGIFTLITGGQFRVWGPPQTFIEDNNALALGLLMIIPLIVYLGQTVEQRWLRFGMYGFAILCLVSVVGSYSRGGFVGMAAIAVLLWARSKHKLVIGIAAAVAIAVGLSFVPQKWFDRMDTIQNYEEEESAMSRLEMWGHAIRIANERPVIGAGFGVFEHSPTYQRLSPEIAIERNVHSIYFEMLATQGYTGLVLFLLLGSAGLLTARKIKRLTKGREGFEDAYKFANMIQISLVAYAVAGTFQNLSTYDMYYTLLAMIALHYTFVLEKLKAAGAVTASASAQDSGAVPAVNMPTRSFLRHPAR